MEQAKQLDAEDPLKHTRDLFHLPFNGEVVYLCGNSLGLQPKDVGAEIGKELDVWAGQGVEGHFGEDGGWYRYHERFREPMCGLLGCHEDEVVVMNSLTANLHLFMISFYKPTKERNLILIENKAFPSDNYAFASQAALHGFDPEECVVRLGDEHGRLSEDQIEEYLAKNGSRVAIACFGAVNFYTGRVMDMERVTKCAHKAGITMGFDLAHATGNVPLRLHDWGVDFAVFCSYKYLNGGPGAPGGAFCHRKHVANTKMHRLAGWWGNDPNTRFEMRPKFEPIASADAWQLSNAPVFGMAPLFASVRLFHEIGFDALRAKSVKLTTYLMDLIEQAGLESIEVLTPRDHKHHGCQVSVRVLGGTPRLLHTFGRLEELGVLADKRMPDVIRLSPVPLYNTFTDVWQTVQALKLALGDDPIVPKNWKHGHQQQQQQQQQTPKKCGDHCSKSGKKCPVTKHTVGMGLTAFALGLGIGMVVVGGRGIKK